MGASSGEDRAVMKGAASVSALRASVPSAHWPWFEYEDGYPEDEDFEALRSLPMDWFEGARWLFRELPRAAENMPCYCEVAVTKDRFGKEVVRIEFSTGGWSGAESVMALVETRADLGWKYMESWRRGGHYVFEIPVSHLHMEWPAQGGEARQGGDAEGGSVHEHPVAEGHAPTPSSPSPSPSNRNP